LSFSARSLRALLLYDYDISLLEEFPLQVLDTAQMGRGQFR
jgi:hypothetical protein